MAKASCCATPTVALRKGEVVRVDVMRQGSRLRRALWRQVVPVTGNFPVTGRDGSTLIPPVNGVDCAACHRNAGADKDFVFRVSAPARRALKRARQPGSVFLCASRVS